MDFSLRCGKGNYKLFEYLEELQSISSTPSINYTELKQIKIPTEDQPYIVPRLNEEDNEIKIK